MNIPNLNDNIRSPLGNKITEKECFDVMCTFANDKTPGSDGLPIEFYRTFWNDIKTLICAVFNECFETNSLCPSMRRGIITLIPKKDKNILLLKNWRPISLLNNDYKILAKIISFRLKHVLDPLIHEDQCGFFERPLHR